MLYPCKIMTVANSLVLAINAIHELDVELLRIKKHIVKMCLL